MRQKNFYDNYPITAILLLLIGGFFALELMAARNVVEGGGGMLGLAGVPSKVAVDLGSMSTQRIHFDQEYWRLLSCVFLHGGLLHILMNGSVLLDLGRVCETKLSSPKFFTIYVLSGIGGSTASYLWRVSKNDFQSQSLGASGALCGLIGMLLVFSIKERKHELRSAITRWIIFMAVISLLIPGIDHFAHLGGFAVGGVLGLTVKDYVTSREARMWQIPAWICAALVACSLGVAVWHNGQQNWDWRLPW